jgi:hypothetical protein
VHMPKPRHDVRLRQLQRIVQCYPHLEPAVRHIAQRLDRCRDREAVLQREYNLPLRITFFRRSHHGMCDAPAVVSPFSAKVDEMSW